MAKSFRVTNLILSGKDLSINLSDTGSFLRHDGTFAPPLGYVNSGQTGNFLTTYQTGQFYPTSNPSGFLITGNITGAGNISVFASGNVFVISGNVVSGATMPFDFGYVNVDSGSLSSQFISFHQEFGSTPNVYGNLINNSGDSLVAFRISGISTSGFYVNMSDVLDTNNYYFDYMATTGLGFFNFAMSSFTTQTNINQGTITGVGTSNYIPVFTSDGSGIKNSIMNQDATGINISTNLNVNSMIIPNATFRIKDGQIQFFDIVAWSGDNTMPWRALGVYDGASVWSDPILD